MALRRCRMESATEAKEKSCRVPPAHPLPLPRALRVRQRPPETHSWIKDGPVQYACSYVKSCWKDRAFPGAGCVRRASHHSCAASSPRGPSRAAGHGLGPGMRSPAVQYARLYDIPAAGREQTPRLSVRHIARGRTTHLVLAHRIPPCAEDPWKTASICMHSEYISACILYPVVIAQTNAASRSMASKSTPSPSWTYENRMWGTTAGAVFFLCFALPCLALPYLSESYPHGHLLRLPATSE